MIGAMGGGGHEGTVDMRLEASERDDRATGLRTNRQSDDSELDRQMKLAEEIMRDDRALLRRLAR